MYDDPLRGFVILPWDLDDVMSAELAPADADPFTWTSVAAGDMEPHPLWALARENPSWRAQFVSNLDRIEKDVYSGLGAVAKSCCKRVWPALSKDPHYAYDKEDFDKDCQYLQDHVAQRSKFIRAFLDAGKN